MEKNKGGRPKKYTLEYCTAEITEISDRLFGEDGAKYLTWQDLIRDKHYPRQCISEWRNAFSYDEKFSDTIKKIDSELEDRLFKGGLTGKYNGTLAIFGLKNNYGWKDKQDIGLGANDNNDISITINHAAKD